MEHHEAPVEVCVDLGGDGRRGVDDQHVACAQVVGQVGETAVGQPVRGRHQESHLVTRAAAVLGRLRREGRRGEAGARCLVQEGHPRTPPRSAATYRPDSGRILGRLGVLATPSRLPAVEITSFVAAVPADIKLALDPVEVVDATWIPLSVLRSVEAASELSFVRAGEQFTFPSIVHEDYTIWGLTHRILSEFVEVLEAAGI